MDQIVLASRSPRRKQLLEWAEIPFEIVVRETEESFPAGMPVEQVPVYIARKKAIAVRDALNDSRTVLAADTVVVLGEQIIGKPQDRQDAIHILGQLSGQIHQVITGVVVLAGDKEHAFADITRVEFHPITLDDIVFYVDKYRPYDKAGAYAIQEWIGVTGIKSIEGDFYNVMGLPVSRVKYILAAL